MASLREFVPERFREIEAELRPLFARLRELRNERAELRQVAERIGLSLGESKGDGQLNLGELARQEVGRRVASEATIKEAVIMILREAKYPMTANQILPRINARLDVDYPRSSLSPQLSRLKAEGRLKLDGNFWSLNEDQKPVFRFSRAYHELAAAKTSHRMSDHWAGMLKYMVDCYPSILTNDELVSWGQENGYNFSRHSLRASLYGWRERGYIEAIADGQHRVTDKGAAAVGRSIPSQQEGPTQSVGPS